MSYIGLGGYYFLSSWLDLGHPPQQHHSGSLSLPQPHGHSGVLLRSDAQSFRMDPGNTGADHTWSCTCESGL